MIIDDIKNFKRYANTNKNIETALNYLHHTLQKDVFEEGVFEIDTNVKAVHILADLKEANEINYELHRNYMDIHAVYEGIECFGYSKDNENVTYNYDMDNDIAFIENSAVKMDSIMALHKNSFCAVWPLEYHKPLILNVDKSKKTVKKIIVKVKL